MNGKLTVENVFMTDGNIILFFFNIYFKLIFLELNLNNTFLLLFWLLKMLF